MKQNWLNNKGITKNLLSQYFQEKYQKVDSVMLQYFNVIQNIKPLIQNDYGLAGDCTLTCITCILYYLYQQPIQTIYDIVEANAKKYGYNGKIGTIPIVINNIIKRSEKQLQIKNQKWKSGYIKGLGFDFNTIKKLIDQKHPVILSLTSDGRGYYHGHSVTIVGYAQYLINDKLQRFLLIYDNWRNEAAYLDYEILGKICSINYYI